MKNINLKKGVKTVGHGVKTTVVTAAASASLLAFLTLPAFTIELINTTVSTMPKVMNISVDNVDSETGDFTGEVFTDRSGEVWEVTGTVVGSKIEFELQNLVSSERIVATGSLSDDGQVEGIAADTRGSRYEWEATDGLANLAES